MILRPSLFPGWPPYISFSPPEEEDRKGEEDVEEIPVTFTAPPGTSPPVIESFSRAGFKYIQVMSYSYYLSIEVSVMNRFMLI